ncbi:MAG: hypothetical protein KDI03_18905 [Anaerolineae bacterium]|nr:hypothetical protein [Anaerolineae bacterium]
MRREQLDSFELSGLTVEPSRDCEQVSDNALEPPIGKGRTSQGAIPEICQQIVRQIGEQNQGDLSIKALFATSLKVQTAFISAKLLNLGTTA